MDHNIREQFTRKQLHLSYEERYKDRGRIHSDNPGISDVRQHIDQPRRSVLRQKTCGLHGNASATAAGNDTAVDERVQLSGAETLDLADNRGTVMAMAIRAWT